ncbi:unnamed protein product [Discosporangium mesarthrocarpum]
MDEMFEAIERDLVPQTRVGARRFPGIVTLSPAGLLIRRDTAEGLEMDFHETDKGYEIHADLPGFRKEDITLDIDSGTRRLNLSAGRKREGKEERKDEEGGPRYHFFC